MALTYGFYNSVNHDRLYDAVQFGQVFDGIISDGVYANYKQALMVKASTEDNEVIVQPGRAWFNHTWTYNDANLPVTAPAPALILDRIDALCLDINADTTKRENSLVWVKGTEATNPVKPTNFIHTETQNQYPLCFVRRRADTAQIRQADIENAIGTSLCPFVTGIIDTIEIDALIAQWNAQWNDWTDEQRTAFMTWFDNLQYVLDGDVAGHLQNEIDALENVLTDISYFEGDNVPSDGYASRNYKEGDLIWFPLEQSFYVAWDNISSGSQFTDSNLADIHRFGDSKNLYDYIMNDIKTKYDYLNTRISNINTDLGNRITANTNSINSVSGRVTTNTNSINNLNTRVTNNTNSINSHTSSINNHTSRLGTLENEFTANGNRLYMDYKNGKYGVNTSASRGANTFIPFKQAARFYYLGRFPATTTFNVSQYEGYKEFTTYNFVFDEVTGAANCESRGEYETCACDMSINKSYNANTGVLTLSGGSGHDKRLGPDLTMALEIWSSMSVGVYLVAPVE